MRSLKRRPIIRLRLASNHSGLASGSSLLAAKHEQSIDIMAETTASEPLSIMREGHRRWTAASTRLFGLTGADR